MGDNNGASNSTRDSSDASSGEVAETATAFQGWKYRNYFVLQLIHLIIKNTILKVTSN